MKNKLPKFLIAANEQAMPETLFILHTREPKFLAKVIPTDALELLAIQKYYPFGVQTRFNGQLFAIVVLEFYDDAEIDEKATGSGGLMSRMGDWFYNYLTNQKRDEQSHTK